MKEENWLSNIHDSLHELDDICHYLIMLGDSFDMTGNTIMGNNLVSTSTNITNNIKRIRESVQDHIHNEFKQSQESSKNIVKALFESIKKQVD